MGLFRRKSNELQDLRRASAALRVAVQALSRVDGPENTASWLEHYRGMLTTEGPWLQVARELHANYKESL